MTPVRQQALRRILQRYPDGVTTTEAAQLSKFPTADVRRSLRAMPDAYVDRWVLGKRGQYMKVWRIAAVPQDCPHPKDRRFAYAPPKTKWVSIGVSSYAAP